MPYQKTVVYNKHRHIHEILKTLYTILQIAVLVKDSGCAKSHDALFILRTCYLSYLLHPLIPTSRVWAYVLLYRYIIIQTTDSESLPGSYSRFPKNAARLLQVMLLLPPTHKWGFRSDFLISACLEAEGDPEYYSSSLTIHSSLARSKVKLGC